MIEIELVPDLSHCIETVAKKEYQEITARILSGKAVTDELKKKAEILRLFLVNADFKSLRAESEAYLLQGKSVTFTVYLENNIVKNAFMAK